MLSPQDCSNMADIRTEIDRIDREVIELLGYRFQYVKAAAPFKTSQTDVKAPERFVSMLKQRRQWADEVGLNADVIESLYRDLVTHFIQEEMKRWESNPSQLNSPAGELRQ